MEVELLDTLNKNWKNDKTGFGFKMLQKMGWNEDKGLGKNETGMTTSIKVSKREIGLGLGGEQNIDHAGNKAWSQTTASFNSVLEVLKAAYKKPSKKEKKVKKSTPTISVGMKYKRHTEAKNLSTKSDAELKAILGAAATSVKQPKNTVIVSEDSEESTEQSDKKEKKNKNKKEKKEKKRSK